jgi:hypothetical protein
VRFLTPFTLACGAFEVVEVVVLHLLPGRSGSRQAPAILRDVVAAVVGGFILASRAASAEYEGPGRIERASCSPGCGGSSG